MADEQEEAYLRALRRLEKEKQEKKNQQGLVGCLLFIVIAFALAMCVSNSGNDYSSSDHNSSESRPSRSATSYPPRLVDPTVAEWRAANEFDRDGAVRAWTEALSPGMSSSQVAARARELGDCIEEAQPAAPPDWKVRENLAATCALLLGWR